MPLPSIYGWDEPIADPEIRAVYRGDIMRQSQSVLTHSGMAKLMFGNGDGRGFSFFGLFGPTTGGEVGGDE